MFPVIPEFLLVGVVLKISLLLSPSEASRCGAVTLGSLTWVCVCLRTQPWSSPAPFTSHAQAGEPHPTVPGSLQLPASVFQEDRLHQSL